MIMPSLAEVLGIKPPVFCEIDINGGHFWSRYTMVMDGLDRLRAYRATCIAQGMTADQFPSNEFYAVMNNQAHLMYNVVPDGRA